MDEKITQRVTLDDLAAMIERTIAHKEDLERIEKITTETLVLVRELPQRIRDEILDVASLNRRVSEIRHVIHEKFPEVHLEA